MIYFDNAATTFPKPVRVQRAVRGAIEHYGANPGRSGHKLAIQTALKVFECREAVANLFHGAAEDVVFTQNCSHALNIAIKGILEQGDHVIISDLEHNSVFRPVHALAEGGLITYDVAHVVDGDAAATAAAFEALVTPRTKLIACTHASNVFGVRVPVEELGALCRRRGILFLVDAAQTAGALEIDMQAMGIDFLCAAGHKGLYGPSGTGVLVTGLGSRLQPLMHGGTGSFSADPVMPDTAPERLECGTVNTAGIIGLMEGIAFVQEKGTSTIHRHECRLAGEIHRALDGTPGVWLFTDTFDPTRHVPVVAFNIDGLHSEEVAQQLSDMGFCVRGGLHCAPLAHDAAGTLDIGAARVSVGAFNTAGQAEGLCDAVRRIARRRT